MEEQSEYEVIDTAEEDYSEISSVASSDYEAEVFLSDIIGKVRDESVERDEIQKDVISKKKIEAIIEIFEKATDQLEGLPFDGWKHAEAETRGIADLLSSASTSLRRLFSKSDLDSDEKPEPQPTGRVQDDKPKPIKVPEVKLQAAIKRDLRTSAESSAGDTNFWMENSSKIGAFGLALLVVVIGIAMYSMWPSVSVNRLVGEIQTKLNGMDSACKAIHDHLIDIRRMIAAGNGDKASEAKLYAVMQRHLKKISLCVDIF